MTRRSPTPVKPLRHCRSFGLTFVVALAIAVAGCGSSSLQRLGAGGQPTQIQMQQDAVRFAHCMRSHGVSNFPDPSSPRAFKSALSPSSGVSRSPAFRSGAAACRYLLPPSRLAEQDAAQQTRTRVADGLSFARCMRSHGMTRFPDPTARGELSIEMVEAQGIDVHAPGVLQVVQACLPASHGALTAAKVRAALSKAGG